MSKKISRVRLRWRRGDERLVWSSDGSLRLREARPFAKYLLVQHCSQEEALTYAREQGFVRVGCVGGDRATSHRPLPPEPKARPRPDKCTVQPADSRWREAHEARIRAHAARIQADLERLEGPLQQANDRTPPLCMVANCCRYGRAARGLCDKHYSRAARWLDAKRNGWDRLDEWIETQGGYRAVTQQED